MPPPFVCILRTWYFLVILLCFARAHINAESRSAGSRALTLCSHTRIPSLLYPLCVGAGMCYGSMFALVLALTADLFGPDHLGTNYGLLDLGEEDSLMHL